MILAKLYAMGLEARVTAWAEHRKCRAQGQAVFRKDFCTTDQIFIIRTLVQQARHAKRKLHCCFVDFKKAFDLVPRDCLWKVLKQRGMAGRVLSSLQSMYTQDGSCILTSEGATEMFECSIGVKQGCPASPQAAKRAMFGLLRQCQRLHIHDPIVKCKLFDTLVKPMLCYSCEIWSISSIVCLIALISVTSGPNFLACFKMLWGACVCSCGTRPRSLSAIVSLPCCRRLRHEHNPVLISQAG